MDLNRVYFQHQIAIMRASAAPNSRIRTLHRSRATAIGEKIANIQRKLGAGASVTWDGRWRCDEEWLPGGTMPV